MHAEVPVLIADGEPAAEIENDGSEERKEHEGCSEGSEKDEERTEGGWGAGGMRAMQKSIC